LSRRKRRPAGAPPATGAEPGARSGAGSASAASGAGVAAGRPAGGDGQGAERRIALDAAVLILVFAVTAAIAELAGAANLGVALGVGQVAFAIALMVVLLRG
jgi:hypothetical protein